MPINTLYLLLVVPALISLYAQARVREIFKKYGAIPNRMGASGLKVAEQLLAYKGLKNVAVEQTPGHLTDHYDSQNKKLRLSDSIADASTVTSLGVVAHEVGHAVQDAEGYRFMRMRTNLGRLVSLLAQLSPLVFVWGFLYGSPIFMWLGAVMLASQALFALVTLPVERNASDRALSMLEQAGLVLAGEIKGARQVLRAAALTYLTALGQRLGTFLFFVVAVVLVRGVWQP